MAQPDRRRLRPNWLIIGGGSGCSLHERADPGLLSVSQLLQCEARRPHGAFVEVRLVAEAERRIPRLELLRVLEEADDLAVLGIRGHPVPESRHESWCGGCDDRMEPLAHRAIRFRHRGDLREDGTLPVRPLQLLDALLHRESFLVRKSLELLAGHGGALGGLTRVFLWAHGKPADLGSPTLLCREIPHVWRDIVRDGAELGLAQRESSERGPTCPGVSE